MTKNKQAARKIFEMQCQICKAMAHPTRLEIVELLHGHEMSAAALLEALETSKANLSKTWPCSCKPASWTQFAMDGR